jgi:hypothetical protein
MRLRVGLVNVERDLLFVFAICGGDRNDPVPSSIASLEH